MSAESVARAHQRGRQQLTDAVSHLARDLWRQMDPANLDASWVRIAPQLLVGLTGAQLAAARTADGYVADMLAEQGAAAAAAFTTNPGALAGIASDGRDLPGLLLNAVTTVKTSIGAGATIEQSMAGGLANLTMLVQTQVADAGRGGDSVAMVARHDVQGYVRMVSGGACGRCVVLAGKFYRWNKGFERHPHCHCTHAPAAGHDVDDIRTHPRAFFDSLSAREQDKQFTKAGAQAIRDGGDMGRVVNASRSMYTAAGKKFTHEATTVLGRRARLMPEQIYAEAKGDRAEAQRLLERHGYIRRGTPHMTPPRVQILEPVPEPTFAQRAGKAATGQKAIDSPAFDLERRPRPAEFTEAMYEGLQSYSSSGFAPINRKLRGIAAPSSYRAAQVQRDIAGIDAAMAASRLGREILTYRGVLDGTPMFGGRLGGDLTGMVWREDAYLSTSANHDTTVLFSVGARGTQKPMVMRILTAAGTPAVTVSGMYLEAEVLLGRGLRLRVVADRGIDRDGIRHIDVEVLRD